VPASVMPEDRAKYEKTLFVMPEDHPLRAKLRQVLARSYVKSFNETLPQKYKDRFDLFKNALALHDSSDFVPGGVMTELVPMAQWIAARYEQLGDEAVVLASLRYLMLAAPDDAKVKERYTQLSDWSESVRDTIEEKLERYNSITELYMRMIKLVPDKVVVEHVASTFLKRQKSIMVALAGVERAGGMFPPQLIRSLMREGGMAKELIHAFFLAGDLPSALVWLKKMDVGSSGGSEYITLLEDIQSEKSAAEGYFELASLLGRDDPGAAMRACLKAREHDRQDPRFSLCIGRFFSEMGRPESAVEFYSEAASIAPEESVMVRALSLARVSLFDIHKQEHVKGARRLIEKLDELVDKAVKMDSEDSDMSTSIAALLHTCGEVEFDDGRIDAAAKHFERAEKIWPGLFLSTLKLVEIYQMRDRHKVAIEVMDRALARGRDHGDEFEMWRAMILEQRADSLSELGKNTRAQANYREALQAWERADVPATQRPKTQIRKGVILDRLGKLDDSREAFRKAIRLDPNMRATYAELLSFLVRRGRLKDAEEFYMIAFNQDRIEAMWKIYYSLWVEGLSFGKGEARYAPAWSYLEQRKGDSWQDLVARFYTDQITEKELRSHAIDTSRKVEANYYVALKLLTKGNKKDAVILLENVIKSDLMGFFEYRLAHDLLKNLK